MPFVQRHTIGLAMGLVASFWTAGWITNFAWALVVVSFVIMGLAISSLTRSQTGLRAATEQLGKDVKDLNREIIGLKQRVAPEVDDER